MFVQTCVDKHSPSLATACHAQPPAFPARLPAHSHGLNRHFHPPPPAHLPDSGVSLHAYLSHYVPVPEWTVPWQTGIHSAWRPAVPPTLTWTTFWFFGRVPRSPPPLPNLPCGRLWWRWALLMPALPQADDNRVHCAATHTALNSNMYAFYTFLGRIRRAAATIPAHSVPPTFSHYPLLFPPHLLHLPSPCLPPFPSSHLLTQHTHPAPSCWDLRQHSACQHPFLTAPATIYNLLRDTYSAIVIPAHMLATRERILASISRHWDGTVVPVATC